MNPEEAARRLWECCRDSMRGWKSSILSFGKQEIEMAYQRGVEDGKREAEAAGLIRESADKKAPE